MGARIVMLRVYFNTDGISHRNRHAAAMLGRAESGLANVARGSVSNKGIEPETRPWPDGPKADAANFS